MKTIILRILGMSVGLACDAALIHNFFYKDNWNKYCDNYITFFECFSWVGFFSILVMTIWLVIASANSEFLDQNRKKAEELSKRVGDIWGKVYYFANSLPMLFFVWVFVGDVSLGIVWGLIAIMQVWEWETAKKVREKLSKIDDSGARLADLLKTPSQN